MRGFYARETQPCDTSRLQYHQLGVRFIFAVAEVKKHFKSRASPSRSIIVMIEKMAPIPCNFGSEISLQTQLLFNREYIIKIAIFQGKSSTVRTLM